jgi:hypothetical protein
MIRKPKDYPRQLVIGENIWDLRFCRKIPEEPSTTLGLCDPSEHVIWIRMGQTPEERFKTLAHELCHALAFEWGLKENHAIIHALEEPILRFFLDNGWVI